MQFATSSPIISVQEIADAFVTEGLQREWIADGVVSQSEKQESELWRIRELMVPAQKMAGNSIKHDISVPVARLPDLVKEVNASVTNIDSRVIPYPFGHIGDGNLHYNMMLPCGLDQQERTTIKELIHREVYDIVATMNGSFSAEHGIGMIKRHQMALFKPSVEIDMMKKIKHCLDPQNQMNPGKVLP